MIRLRWVPAFALLLASPAAGQAGAGAPDTLRLHELHWMAEGADPRAGQADLLNRRSDLHGEDIRRDRLPTLLAGASARYSSQVAGLPGGVGFPVPSPAHDQYDSWVSLTQPLFDPSIAGRLGVELARAEVDRADLRTTLWQQRLQVTAAFFGIQLAQGRIRSHEVAMDALAERRRVAAARVEAGEALRSEVHLLDAERIRLVQAIVELQAEAQAARIVLESLVGTTLPEGAVLAPPGGIEDSPAVLPPLGRDRPEYEGFDRTRGLLASRTDALAARTRPRASLQLRSGYGRPGLNPLGDQFDPYYQAGVQLDWAPWDRGASRSDAGINRIEGALVDTREAAFTAALERALAGERARIGALEQGLQADAEIIALREAVLAETRLRHDEGEVTAADYVARLGELLEARLARDTRQTTLLEARARYLTTAGREVR